MIFQSIFFYIVEIMNHFWNLILTFNRTALIFAALKGHTEVVRLLLEQENIDINLKSIFFFNYMHS